MSWTSTRITWGSRAGKVIFFHTRWSTFLLLATLAHASPPGTRTAWEEQPTGDQFWELAGEAGYVVAMDAERWRHVLVTVETSKSDLRAAYDRITALERVIAAQEAHLVAAERLTRSWESSHERLVQDLARAEKAVLRAPGRQRRAMWIGFGLGAVGTWAVRR